MGFRFRKSFKIMPGVRVNFSKSGTSLSLGGKGVTHNISAKGSRTTFSLRGTGLSYTTRSNPKTIGRSSVNLVQSQTAVVRTVADNKKAMGRGSIVLIAFVAISILAILSSDKKPDTQSLPPENIVGPVSLISGNVESKADGLSLVHSEQSPVNHDSSGLGVVREGSEAGFMLVETDGKSTPHMDSTTVYKIKSGAEIVVKGRTKDNVWLIVSGAGYKEEYYVPASNVAKFSQQLGR